MADEFQPGCVQQNYRFMSKTKNHLLHIGTPCRNPAIHIKKSIPWNKSNHFNHIQNMQRVRYNDV